MPLVPTSSPAPPVVLDTNVVFDWLLFGHPDGLALGSALGRGELRWIATAAMRDEFAHVLARGALGAWTPDRAVLEAAWDGHCVEVRAPPPDSLASRFRCTDPDDQKFIDLAVAHGPCLLLTRDRAVLKLAKRLRSASVDVLNLSAWVTRRATG